jgi:hypothetical protein
METDCSYTWKKNAKAALAAALKDNRKAEMSALQKQFDDKLCKLLEKWTAEWVKDPKFDLVKLAQTRKELGIMVKSYKDKAATAVIGHAGPLLVHDLGELDKALGLRLQILTHSREQNLKLAKFDAENATKLKAEKEAKLKAAKEAKLKEAKLKAEKEAKLKAVKEAKLRVEKAAKDKAAKALMSKLRAAIR